MAGVMTWSNQIKGQQAEDYLLALGQGFKRLPLEQKKRLARANRVLPSSFDLVQRRTPDSKLTLVEVKGTDEKFVSRHFFSVTEAEVDAAERMQDRYCFVIVYGLEGRKRHESFSWKEFRRRLKSATVQFAIRLNPTNFARNARVGIEQCKCCEHWVPAIPG